MPEPMSSVTETKKSLSEILQTTEDQYHYSLAETTGNKPCLLVFLRRLGCCFCRQALADLKFALAGIEQSGCRLVIVHMSTEEEASQILAGYGLADISRVSDPDQKLYKYFGVEKIGLDKFFTPGLLVKVLETVLAGHGIAGGGGDALQMHGVFLIHKGKLIQSFLPESPQTRPDYIKIANCAVAQPIY